MWVSHCEGERSFDLAYALRAMAEELSAVRQPSGRSTDMVKLSQMAEAAREIVLRYFAANDDFEWMDEEEYSDWNDPSNLY